MTRKIIAAIVAVVAVFAFVVTVSAQTSSFTINLTVGSRGTDVVALQTFLESKGFLVMPAGVAKGYFGSLTKSSLARYQSSKGITPAVGYFGPITRAAVSAEGSVATGGTPGCPAGSMYNTLTGAPCSTTPATPGCPAGAMYNYMTGAPCSTTSTGGSTSSTEGTLDVRQAGTPANNANVQSSVDVPVYGLTLKATIADVTVDRLDLVVGVNNAGATETPSTLINTIKVWDGSTVVKTWSVTSADFIKDVNLSTKYYVRLSGLNLVVPKDATKNLVVSFSTTSGIDTDRTVTIYGYGTNSLRAVSGNNITSYYDISGILRTHTFKKPGSSNLTVSSDSNAADSNNNKVSRTDGVKGVAIGTFNVRSETGDSVVTDVTVPVYASGTAPSTVYLYDGSTLLDSRTGNIAPGYVTFSNVSVAVSKDVTKTLTVKVDMPSGTATGSASTIASSTGALTVTYTKPNGNAATASATGLSSGVQYFFNAAPMFTFVSGTATTGGTTQTGSTTSMTGTFVFKVKPNGASMTALTASNVTIKAASSSATNFVTVTSKTISVSPNDSTYADGGDYTVTVTGTLFNADITGGSTGNGVYTFYITGITWTTDGVTTAQTYGLDDYKTNPVTFVH